MAIPFVFILYIFIHPLLLILIPIFAGYIPRVILAINLIPLLAHPVLLSLILMLIPILSVFREAIFLHIFTHPLLLIPIHLIIDIIIILSILQESSITHSFPLILIPTPPIPIVIGICHDKIPKSFLAQALTFNVLNFTNTISGFNRLMPIKTVPMLENIRLRCRSWSQGW
uniref:Uncharacterized protein n=1 Tax=Opuntia streptacantha TaxID=393608 RepID=A0A7C8ZRL1_OPUST